MEIIYYYIGYMHNIHGVLLDDIGWHWKSTDIGWCWKKLDLRWHRQVVKFGNISIPHTSILVDEKHVPSDVETSTGSHIQKSGFLRDPHGENVGEFSPLCHAVPWAACRCCPMVFPWVFPCPSCWLEIQDGSGMVPPGYKSVYKPFVRELDDGTFYRNALYLMVKTCKNHGFL